MSKANGNGKPIRFAALIRVSTEGQEKEGESLRTQRSQNERDADRLGGKIVRWYGGQEHATPGWEKQEVDRLLRDAAKGKFDGVLVQNADRWSRDNASSKHGLELLRKHGVRFFVGATEMNLFNPEHRLLLGMSAEIGEFLAIHQNKKSIENRIEVAKSGRPACGKPPFGRTFDKKTGQWGIDRKKQAMVQDVASRYLAGETLRKIADEYHVNHPNLHKILTTRSGDSWVQHFDSDDLNIHEVIPTKIPRLLDEDIIKAIKQKAEANKTYSHGQLKNQYLLGRLVFCSHCGYAMSGQTNHEGGRYYRHANRTKCTKAGKKAWVNAADLEQAVFVQLFQCFGNPVAVQKAIEDATPNRDKIDELVQRRKRLWAELEKFDTCRQRVIGLVLKGTIGEGEATKQLDDAQSRGSKLQEELDRLNTSLDHLPDQAQVKAVAKRFAGKFKRTDARLWAKTEDANSRPEAMSWNEKRALFEMVFSGRTTDGKRMGVFIEWIAGQEGRLRKTWNYRIIGHLIDEKGTSPLPTWLRENHEEDCQGGHRQRELLDKVTKSALSTARTPRPPLRSMRTPTPTSCTTCSPG